MRRSPLAVDLFSGCFGWSRGWLELGGHVVGFDLEHLPHHGPVPKGADLVLQDVLTIDGAQFKDASLILASPPCQAYSYMAMPFTKGKAKAAWYREVPERQEQLTALFRACFRIQREASAAAGHHIPMVVENVRGAQPWVGRARWAFGSFYLWGDVPALMPITMRAIKSPGRSLNRDADHKFGSHNMGSGEKIAAELARNDATKNNDGSWFNVGSPGQKIVGQNPDGRKVKIYDEAMKGVGIGSVSWAQGKGQRHPDDPRNFYSGTSARKAASARIATIPPALSRFIAQTYFPLDRTVAVY